MDKQPALFLVACKWFRMSRSLLEANTAIQKTIAVTRTRQRARLRIHTVLVICTARLRHPNNRRSSLSSHKHPCTIKLLNSKVAMLVLVPTNRILRIQIINRNLGLLVRQCSLSFLANH